MKKEKKPIKQMINEKATNKLKNLFEPMLERNLKACYGVLIIHETKSKKIPLTSYEEFCKEVKDFLLKGEN